MAQEFNSANMLQLLWKWKKQLALVLLVAVVVSAIGSSSLFIKPKYKSTAVAYPVNLLPYGEESTTEQLLQLLQSIAVRDSVLTKLNLAQHYEIDSSYPLGKSYLLAEWSENITIGKTDLESAEIKVLDTDPDTACLIVNEILNQANLLARNLQRKSTNELIVMYSKQLAKIKHEIDSMDALIKVLRTDYGIVEFDAQVKEVTRAYMKVAGSSNDPKKLENLEAVRVMRNFQERGGDYLLLKNQINSEKSFYFKKLEEYNMVRTDFTKELTYSNIVSKPIPATKKSYPVRWLIVLISSVSTLFFALIVLGYIDRKNTFTEVSDK
jgi:capsular polysaccharide biosynthesis protein